MADALALSLWKSKEQDDWEIFNGLWLLAERADWREAEIVRRGVDMSKTNQELPSAVYDATSVVVSAGKAAEVADIFDRIMSQEIAKL